MGPSFVFLTFFWTPAPGTMMVMFVSKLTTPASAFFFFLLHTLLYPWDDRWKKKKKPWLYY